MVETSQGKANGQQEILDSDHQPAVDLSKPRHTDKPDTPPETEQKVGEIRDILFGAQRDEYDRRFTRLEELLVKSISDLTNETTAKIGNQRDEYDKRLTRLEELLVKSITDLSNETAEKLGTQRDEYDKRLTRLEELLVNNISELSSETSKRFESLSNSLTEQLKNEQELRTQSDQELAKEKVDKAAVNKLLMEMIKLSGELGITKSEDSTR